MVLSGKLTLALVIAVLIFCVSSLAFALLSLSSQHTACVQIEALKSRVRQKAVQDYQHLPQTVKLLNLKLTPQIREEAKKGRDRILTDYAAQSCGSYFLPRRN